MIIWPLIGARQLNSGILTATLWNGYYYDLNVSHQEAETHRAFLKCVQGRTGASGREWTHHQMGMFYRCSESHLNTPRDVFISSLYC